LHPDLLFLIVVTGALAVPAICYLTILGIEWALDYFADAFAATPSAIVNTNQEVG
jgi:hypothetical protein